MVVRIGVVGLYVAVRAKAVGLCGGEISCVVLYEMVRTNV